VLDDVRIYRCSANGGYSATIQQAKYQPTAMCRLLTSWSYFIRKTPRIIRMVKLPAATCPKTLQTKAEKECNNAIPVQEAVRRGADKILVLRSRPSSYVKRHNLVALISMKVCHSRRRALQKAFNQRPQAYMNAVRFISNPPHGLVIR
jgi:hypothetical protein